jgi:hypothetical protein
MAIQSTDTALLERAYRDATQAPFSEVARTLQDLLSRRLTAVMAGVKDGKTIARWASGEIAEARYDAAEQRLRTAYRIVLLLLNSQDSPQTVKAWFIGLNPHLDDVSPAEAIRNGQLREALAAAAAFVAGG